MKSKVRVIAYSFLFQEMFLSKDIFLVPYYIAKCLGGTLDYIYCHNLGNTIIPTVHRNANIRQSTMADDFRAMLKYIVADAKQIDVLFIWGSSLKHMLIIRIFKFINPKAKIVVFGDMEPPQARIINQTDFMCPKGVKGIVKRYFTNFFMNNVIYIVANTEAYNEMKKLCDRKKWSGLSHFYPCLDDEKLNEYGIKRKSWEEKDNIIICVGRVGCYQKNTEMLLEALKKVDLKEWKIYMIGPVTSSFDLNEKGDFHNVIDRFFEEYPQYNDKLIFTGMIYDQRIVLDYYNRAKVLLNPQNGNGPVWFLIALLYAKIITGCMVRSNLPKFVLFVCSFVIGYIGATYQMPLLIDEGMAALPLYYTGMLAFPYLGDIMKKWWVNIIGIVFFCHFYDYALLL